MKKIEFVDDGPPSEGFGKTAIILGWIGLLFPFLGLLAIIFGAIGAGKQHEGSIKGIVFGVFDLVGSVIIYILLIKYYIGGLKLL